MYYPYFPASMQLNLAYLGYGAELAAMSSVDNLAKHSLVNQTRPLTDRSMLFSYVPVARFDMKLFSLDEYTRRACEVHGKGHGRPPSSGTP